MYYDIFSLLSKSDIEKTIKTNFDEYCDENKYNQNAFETRFALVPKIDDDQKIRAIHTIVNKIELNKQKQYVDKYKLSKIIPIGISIATIAKLNKKENAIIVNMEAQTTFTTVYDRQVYNVETLDIGSQEVLEKINKVENSMGKAYDICKSTTIYTSDVIEDTKEQPYLEFIVPVLYEINQHLQEVILASPNKINTIYLTGTLANVNNVDLYFQEYFPSVDCKILKPSIIDETVIQVNIKDYIEVNSAISIAMIGLGEGVQALNFKKDTLQDKLKAISNVNLGSSNKEKKKKGKSLNINFNLKGDLSKTEQMLIRAGAAIILINIIFVIFSKVLYKQMEKKQTEVEGLISAQNAEIQKINNDINSLNSINSKYNSLTQELKAVNEKISNITQRRNSIPNLLNQLMYIIPERVQLTNLDNTSGTKIAIRAQSDDYDQLGYFIAKIKLEGYLKDVSSSSGLKTGNTVSVTIEGDLP